MAEKNTSVKKWADAATPEQWEDLQKDIKEMQDREEGQKEFAEKYGFSISGVGRYLDAYLARIDERAKCSHENDALKSRIAELEKRVDEQKKMNASKDKEIAQLKAMQEEHDKNKTVTEEIDFVFQGKLNKVIKGNIWAEQEAWAAFSETVTHLTEKHGQTKRYFATYLLKKVAEQYKDK